MGWVGSVPMVITTEDPKWPVPALVGTDDQIRKLEKYSMVIKCASVEHRNCTLKVIASRWFDGGGSAQETAVVVPEATNLAGCDNTRHYLHRNTYRSELC
jgi:hypothetical protein